MGPYTLSFILITPSSSLTGQKSLVSSIVGGICSLGSPNYQNAQVPSSADNTPEGSPSKVSQDQAHNAEQIQQDQAQDTEQVQQIVPYQANQNVAEANYKDPDVIAHLQAAYAAGLVTAEELDFYQAGGN